MSDILDRMSASDKERFWSHVDVGSSEVCWNWKAVVVKGGYGRMNLGAKASSVKRASHRIALTLSVGAELPSHLSVLHSCDNPSCCNPAHLRLGTHQENMDEMKSKGRSPISFGAAKLNWEIVDKIRASTEAASILTERY